MKSSCLHVYQASLTGGDDDVTVIVETFKSHGDYPIALNTAGDRDESPVGLGLRLAPPKLAQSQHRGQPWPLSDHTGLCARHVDVPVRFIGHQQRSNDPSIGHGVALLSQQTRSERALEPKAEAMTTEHDS